MTHDRRRYDKGDLTRQLVMVSGSRTWTDRDSILREFEAWWDARKLADQYCVQDLTRPVTLLHGGARGADLLAADVASRELDWWVTMLPAEWDKYGKRAGIVRNLAMLDRHPAHVFIFWDGESRGTAHVIEQVQSRKMSYSIVQEADLATR